MPIENLEDNLTISINGVQYTFLADTTLERFENGNIKKGILAEDVLTSVNGVSTKYNSGAIIEFSEEGFVKEANHIDIEERNGVVLFKVSGSLETSQALKLEEIINDYLDKNVFYFAFDLGGLYYLSSSGIRVLIATLRLLRDKNGRMTLCNLSGEAMRIINTADLGNIFEIYPDASEAILMMTGGI